MPEYTDVFGRVAMAADAASPDRLSAWRRRLLEEGAARKAEAARRGRLTAGELLSLARQVFGELSEQARLQEGISLPEAFLADLLGELSGLGPIVALLRDPRVTDIALNLRHLYVYRIGEGPQSNQRGIETVFFAAFVAIFYPASIEPAWD